MQNLQTVRTTGAVDGQVCAGLAPQPPACKVRQGVPERSLRTPMQHQQQLLQRRQRLCRSRHRIRTKRLARRSALRMVRRSVRSARRLARQARLLPRLLGASGFRCSGRLFGKQNNAHPGLRSVRLHFQRSLLHSGRSSQNCLMHRCNSKVAPPEERERGRESIKPRLPGHDTRVHTQTRTHARTRTRTHTIIK